MKILHIINNLGSGGAEKLLEDIIPILDEKEDVEVELLLLTGENNVFEESLRDKGIKINILDLNNIYNPKNIILIINFIKNSNFDIIHAHLFPTLYWTSLASKFIINKEFKLIYTEHNTHNKRRDHFFFKPIEKFIYNEYDEIISISSEVKRKLIKWLKIKNKDKVTIIENGIDTQKFKNAERYLKNDLCPNCCEDDIFITMVGRFSEQKDQKTLIKVMKELGDHTHLILVGEGQLINEHKKYTKKLNLDKRVHFLGFRDDVERVLKTSDIIVLSSHWEGFGLVAVEGMAAGKPVLASNVKGLKEIVEGAGLLFEQGNVNYLKKIINKLIHDADFYQKISQRCSIHSGNYDIENMVQNLLEVYNKFY